MNTTQNQSIKRDLSPETRATLERYFSPEAVASRRTWAKVENAIIAVWAIGMIAGAALIIAHS